jgi:hypothetical protein
MTTDNRGALPPDITDWFVRAEDGERNALCDLYGQASAWIRAGRPVPEPLASWIADKLLSVAQVLHERAEGDPARDMQKALTSALGVVRPKRTRRPELQDLALAHDIAHFMRFEGLLPHQACARVVEYHASKRTGVAVSIKTVEAAWAKHGADLKP